MEKHKHVVFFGHSPTENAREFRVLFFSTFLVSSHPYRRMSDATPIDKKSVTPVRMMEEFGGRLPTPISELEEPEAKKIDRKNEESKERKPPVWKMMHYTSGRNNGPIRDDSKTKK